MRKYEVTYILRPQLEEEAVTAAAEKYSQMVTEQGGQVENVNHWGKRTFAYELDRNTEGYYIIMRFVSEPAVEEELHRVMKLSDDILRCLFISVD